MATQFCIHQLQISWLLKFLFLSSGQWVWGGYGGSPPLSCGRGGCFLAGHAPSFFSPCKSLSVPSSGSLSPCSWASKPLRLFFFFGIRLKSRALLASVPFTPHLQSPAQFCTLLCGLTCGHSSESWGGWRKEDSPGICTSDKFPCDSGTQQDRGQLHQPARWLSAPSRLPVLLPSWPLLSH